MAGKASFAGAGTPVADGLKKTYLVAQSRWLAEFIVPAGTDTGLCKQDAAKYLGKVHKNILKKAFAYNTSDKFLKFRPN